MRLQQEGSSSDPLPFTQVDRAVKAKACLLAGRLGVTPQHALGSLVEFWDLNGDPRELERMVLDGKDAVLLTGQEVRHRFLLASGKEVEPSDMVTCGLLAEESPNVFRVRGMSRFFGVIQARIRSRRAAVVGGKASAEARKAKRAALHGGTQTVQQPFNDSSTVGQRFCETVDEPLDNRSTVFNPRGQRTEDREQSLKETTTTAAATPTQPHKVETPAAAAPPPPPPPTEAPPASPTLPTAPPPKAPEDKYANGAAFFAYNNTLRVKAGLVPEKPPDLRTLSTWWNEVGLELNGDYERLEEALYKYAHNAFWQKLAPPIPFWAFIRHWRKYVPQRLPSQEVRHVRQANA